MLNKRKELKNEWVQNFQVAISVCDTRGVLLEMNEKSKKIFQKSGGDRLLGTQILTCHSGPEKEKLKDMLQNKKTNCYTSEKDGIRTLIYQSPWFIGKKYMGLVEFIIVIPWDLPHKKL